MLKNFSYLIDKRKSLVKTRPLNWSGQWDLNPRLQPWEGRTLPLSYARNVC